MNKLLIVFLFGLILASCGTKKVLKNNNLENGWYLVSREVDKSKLTQTRIFK